MTEIAPRLTAGRFSLGGSAMVFGLPERFGRIPQIDTQAMIAVLDHIMADVNLRAVAIRSLFRLHRRGR